MYVDSYLQDRGGRRLNLERVNTELTNQTRAQRFEQRYLFRYYFFLNAIRVPVTSFLSSRYNNRYRARATSSSNYVLFPPSILNYLLHARFNPNCHRYYSWWPATYRGKKTQKSETVIEMPSPLTSNLVNPGQRRGKEKPSPPLFPSRIWPPIPLAKFHFYFLFLPLSFPTTLYNPPPILAYRDRWWLSQEAGNPLASRENLQHHYLSLSLSLVISIEAVDPPLLLFCFHSRYTRGRHARSKTLNRIRGLLFPAPRKIHFPSERRSTLEFFSFRFTFPAFHTARNVVVVVVVWSHRSTMIRFTGTFHTTSFGCSDIFGNSIYGFMVAICVVWWYRGSEEFYVLHF